MVIANILLIDAERATAARAMPALVREGYDVAHALPGQAALETLRAGGHDLVIVSVEPQGTGPAAATWHFCCKVVASITSPLLLLLPDRDEATRVKALQLGADDCMAHPVQILELVARVRALLRRSRRRAAGRKPQRYVDGDLTIDLAAARVSLNGNSASLTPAELRLLTCLVGSAGRPVPAEELRQAACGAHQPASTAAVRRCIGRLRLKLEADPRHPHRLVTRRGEGYALVRTDTPSA